MDEYNSGAAPVTSMTGASASVPAPRQAGRQVAWRQYLQRCAAGDQAALAGLYDETSRMVYTMALRILRDPADAEEVALDVYMQVWKTAQSYSVARDAGADARH